MTANQRQADILFASIGEYIRTGEPVASEDLKRRFRFPFSPATIRNELVTLSDQGYLAQPHTSAGRVPTDAGYRWYVDMIGARRENDGRGLAKNIRREVFDEFEPTRDLDDFFRKSTEAFSEIVQALVVGGVMNDSEPLHKSGFGRVLGDPEFSQEEARNEFGELMDSIDEDVRKLVRSHRGEYFEVFIGDENPIPEARHYSMMVKKIRDHESEGLLAILGPKRMHYDRGLALLQAIEELWGNN
ncbi:MAG: Transcriptional regulator of heat shock protein [Parcubacteria group bacterium GW2011_GWB1_52_7]|nr:MAG: Transcriptional regulator of heat shock protein [Parcubacteria group bacterium GW2011_GWB1_52_7]